MTNRFRAIIASAMRSRAISGAFALLALLFGSSALGQQPPASAPKLAPDPGAFDPGATQGAGGAQQGPRPKVGPAPRFPDGLPNFGGDGAWYPGFSGNIAETRWKGVKSADQHVDVPFLPSALELFNQRVTSNSKDDPEAQCLPVGVPRYMFDPYAFEIVQTPAQVIFLFEGDNYLWRTVPLRPARNHSKDIRPTWLGDSVGRYDKDTLIVDVVGFNGKAWLDQAGH